MIILSTGDRLTYDSNGRLRAANCPMGNTCVVWTEDGSIHPDYADPNTPEGARAAAFLERVSEEDRPLFNESEVQADAP